MKTTWHYALKALVRIRNLQQRFHVTHWSHSYVAFGVNVIIYMSGANSLASSQWALVLSGLRAHLYVALQRVLFWFHLAHVTQWRISALFCSVGAWGRALLANEFASLMRCNLMDSVHKKYQCFYVLIFYERNFTQHIQEMCSEYAKKAFHFVD